MYIDGVILFGLLIVILTCVIVVYLGFYSWKHIKKDSLRAAQEALAQIEDSARSRESKKE